jgi:hypothetical protein
LIVATHVGDTSLSSSVNATIEARALEIPVLRPYETPWRASKQ